MKQLDRKNKLTASFIEVSAIGFRHRGAAYHLSVIRDLVENEIVGKPHTPTADRLRWHVAGFYWELVATFDCALQVVAAAYQLGLPRKTISWNPTYQKALSRKGICNPLTAKIAEVAASDWYQDALARRNTITHWDAAFIRTAVVRGNVVAVLMLNQGDLVSACENYVVKLRELVALAEETLPTGHIAFK